MVRDGRIKTYMFNAGSLTASAAGAISDATTHPLNGRLVGIQRLANTYTATGSLNIAISGTGETIWNLTSGTTCTNVAESGACMPLGHARDQLNNTLSGTAGNGVYVEIPLFGNLILTGAGLGNGTSGLGINLSYI